MADFASWVTAAEPALGWKANSFLEAYIGNRQDANELALESSPVYPPLLELLKDGPVEATSTDLLAKLEQFVTEKVTKGRRWPKNGRALSGALRRLAPNLRRVGIQVEMPTSGRGQAGRVLSICRAEENREADLRPQGPQRPEAGKSGGFGDANGDARDANQGPGTQRDTNEPEPKSFADNGGTQRDARDANSRGFSPRDFGSPFE
jgi:hypothetical protein